jgi:predicted ferric reductase
MLHAITNFYFTIPALMMYIVDLCYRLMQKCSPQEGLVTMEESGMVRIDTKFINCKPGQYFYLTIPAISIMSHPFSVASITNSGMGFLIQPSRRSNTWTDDLLKLVDESITTPIIVDGPYGLAPFEYHRLNVLIVMVGGSGITTVFPCIKEAQKQGITCHIYWSVRDSTYTQLIYFQELVKLDQVYITIFITGEYDLESTMFSGIDVYQERMKPSQHLADVMLAYGNSLVGLYTCGPRTLMDDVENASCLYHNVILYRESYEW